MIEGDRRPRCEVDLLALDTELGLSTFIVRSLEKSPRTWEFDTFRGQITRGFDWEGELIPRQILPAIEFKPVPSDSIDRVFLTLTGKLPKARVRSEREVSRG
jgi:hypothetical protein